MGSSSCSPLSANDCGIFLQLLLSSLPEDSVFRVFSLNLRRLKAGRSLGSAAFPWAALRRHVPRPRRNPRAEACLGFLIGIRVGLQVPY